MTPEDKNQLELLRGLKREGLLLPSGLQRLRELEKQYERERGQMFLGESEKCRITGGWIV